MKRGKFPPTIETERLVIRASSLSDAPAVNAAIHESFAEFEIGYWCCLPHQGCGYVTEAVRALTRVGFEQMGANRIEIRCDPRNARSRHVAERAGYKLEAELRHEQVGPDGALRNTLIYALFPDEYRNRGSVRK